MARIVGNKLVDLVRDREGDKRKAAYLAVSLDHRASIDERRCPCIVCAHCGSRGNDADPFSRIELQLDLASTIRKLTPGQQTLCHLLGQEGLTVTEAGARLNVARTSLHDEVKRIRAVFREEHLDEYLKDLPVTPRTPIAKGSSAAW